MMGIGESVGFQWALSLPTVIDVRINKGDAVQ